LGVEVPTVLALMDSYPVIRETLYIAYNTLIFLITLAIMVPPMCNRMRAAKEFTIGVVLAAAICLPLFAVFQAAGPWVHYQYLPLTDQSNYMRTFAAIKSQEWYAIDLAYSDGLICFPSFHAILAVLAAAALWPIRYVRWPTALLACLIVVSTVTTGSHYVVDVLGGLMVTLLVRVLARWYSFCEERFTGVVPEASGHSALLRSST